MSQQQCKSRSTVGAAPLAADEAVDWLSKEAIGRERFRVLLQQWLRRNNWSLAVVQRLSELALLATSDVPVTPWSAGMALQPGDWVNHRGHVWEAIGQPISEPAEGDAGWREKALTKRLHASGLNLFLRNRNRTLASTFLLELGRLNEWVADVKAGTAQPPAESRLRELVLAAETISDEDGPLGCEELLSIAVGRLMPPPWPRAATAPSTAETGVPARQLRAAAAAAGLDIVEDWEVIASMYPTKDPSRLERLQQVLRGVGQWDPLQEEDEQAACLVLLKQLQLKAAKPSDQ
jgi:hypothetical protein